LNPAQFLANFVNSLGSAMQRELPVIIGELRYQYRTEADVCDSTWTHTLCNTSNSGLGLIRDRFLRFLGFVKELEATICEYWVNW
jgi:hypothetical protein